jgi:hypothetical protein
MMVFAAAAAAVFVLLLFLYERFSIAIAILVMPLLATCAVLKRCMRPLIRPERAGGEQDFQRHLAVFRAKCRHPTNIDPDGRPGLCALRAGSDARFGATTPPSPPAEQAAAASQQ